MIELSDLAKHKDYIAKDIFETWVWSYDEPESILATELFIGELQNYLTMAKKYYAVSD